MTLTATEAPPKGPEGYYAAARSVAKRYHSPGITTLNDLIQICMVSLVEHWHKWDERKANRLTWVLKRCAWTLGQHRTQRRDDRLIRVPPCAIERGHAQPSMLSLSRRDDTGRVEAERDPGTWTFDAAPDDPRAVPVAAMLASLDARSREVITRRFGLDGTEAQTLQRIGDDLGIGKERVRQIERTALRRMHLTSLRGAKK